MMPTGTSAYAISISCEAVLFIERGPIFGLIGGLLSAAMPSVALRRAVFT
jgi:hypothetical protein